MLPIPAYAFLPIVAACVATMPARAEPEAPSQANNWTDLRVALAKCWTIPAGTDGSLLAYRFGLDKTGAIRGKPRIIARQLKGDAEAQRRYQEAADAALAKCFPMPVTSAFGAILGESPLYLRFVNTPPTSAYQINSNITLFAPQ
ncbi:hypothetical protein FV222_01950 [Methylobacterium sp. WL103]|uniref:hypothetical protein n=1 Tax=Methylobacterium sp. WL103 TaxID=2603891 RepID=UPI0011C70BA7|nr:hypothetical protein [Methylobacterium sp. WL103]TXN07682.1 hypothetical protein FV222_01950 [Methylobacterium sp. WL103]